MHDSKNYVFPYGTDTHTNTHTHSHIHTHTHTHSHTHTNLTYILMCAVCLIAALNTAMQDSIISEVCTHEHTLAVVVVMGYVCMC